jgi:hypothetical protein
MSHPNLPDPIRQAERLREHYAAEPRTDYLDLPLARQLDAIEIACQRVMYQRARAEALPESDEYGEWLEQLTDSCIGDAEIGRRAREMVAHYMQDVAVLRGEDLADLADLAEGRSDE